MQPAQSVSDVSKRIHDVLEIAADQAKAIDRGGRYAVDKEFEGAFRAHGGPYTTPQLDYDTQSDDDEDAGEAAATTKSSSARKGAASKAVVTNRDALNLLIMTLNLTLTAQSEAAVRVAHKALIPSSVSVLPQVCAQLIGSLHQCSDYLHTEGVANASELSKPADRETLGWVEAAVEVTRRSTRLLSWLQVRKIGEDALQAATQKKLDAYPPSAKALATTTPPAIPLETAQESSAQPPTKLHAAKQNPPPPVPYHQRFNSRPADEDAKSDNGSASSTHSNNPVNATALLMELESLDARAGAPPKEAEVELDFGVHGAAAPTSLAGGGNSTTLFDTNTAVGRRNYRANMLLKLVVNASNEKFTDTRKKIILSSPTLREWMSVLAKLDFNIISFQVRSISQQIGESGPLLWSAALDVCVSEKYEDKDNTRKAWMPDRMGTELLESNVQEKYRWVQLVQSEGCMRGSYAKQRIVSMAAKLLFPQDFEYYCSLGREDVCLPDDPEEWECISRSVIGDNASLNRTFSFVLDRTSFIAQAFRLLENQNAGVGKLTLDISEERSVHSRLSPTRKPDAYVVRIRCGDGTVLVSQNSDELHVGGVPTAALVPTLFDVLHKTAEVLGVLPHYTLLKNSFDRLRLPVANEPREYIQDYLALIFGTIRLENGALIDTVEVSEQALGGLWTTNIKIGYPSDPLKNTEEFKYVCLEVWSAVTKRGARNDALLRVGKTNFAPEVLRMLKYGPTAQKAQAESILLVETEAVIALSDPLQQEMAKLSGAAVAEDSKAPGAVVDTFAECCQLSPSGRLISNAISSEVKSSQIEVESSIIQNFPNLDFEVQWKKEAMKDFYATLLREERCFGHFVSLVEGALTSMTTGDKGEYGSVPITGNAPIAALHSATRVFKEKLDGAPNEVKTRIKSLRTVPEQSRPVAARVQPSVRTLQLPTSPIKAPSVSTCGQTEPHYWSTVE